MKNRRWIIFACGALVVAGLFGSVLRYVPNTARAEHDSQVGLDSVLDEANSLILPDQADRAAYWKQKLAADLESLQSGVTRFTDRTGRLPGVASDGSFALRRFVVDLTGSQANGQDPLLRDIPANPYVSGPKASEILAGYGRPRCDGSSGWWLDMDTARVWSNDAASTQEP